MDLLIFKRQPNFPNEDINSSNADVFVDCFANPAALQIGHVAAEKGQAFYSEVHATARQEPDSFISPDHYEYFLRGMATYEAMAYAINHNTRQFLPQTNLVASRTLRRAMAADDAADRMIDCHDALTQNRPNLCAVVAEVLAINGLHLRYALMGAGMELSLEITANQRNADFQKTLERDEEERRLFQQLEDDFNQ